MNEYFAGSVAQLIERGRLLRAKVPRDLPRDYDTLAQACKLKLNGLLDLLRSVLEEPIYRQTDYQPERLRLFKRIVAELDMVETVGIAALDRAKADDHKLNELLEKIAQEIGYPLVTPVVTTLSQQYFCIVTELNLLCVPLTEGRFLLHLPDLYHELAHPLLIEQDDPVVEPIQAALFLALRDALGYLADELAKEDRRRGPAQPTFMLQRWEIAWVKFWMVEFFCDLFAVYTLGPAYVWAHLHLTAKRGGDPFEVPILSASSHPADDARMRVMLLGLNLSGFTAAAAAIGLRWRQLLAQVQAKPEPEYHRCFPDGLLAQVANYARTGVEEIGCRLAIPSTGDPVHAVLNLAWEEFWRDPGAFVDWEREAVAALMP
ncbi:MAG: hypothetical protein JSS97_16225 [Actinobacteria bacterium]|nr:hypothetical protein [Actinomycetota bacterium]